MTNLEMAVDAESTDLLFYARLAARTTTERDVERWTPRQVPPDEPSIRAAPRGDDDLQLGVGAICGGRGNSREFQRENVSPQR